MAPSLAYVTNETGNSVSVIDSPTNATYNTVITTVPVGSHPWGVAVSPNRNPTPPPAAAERRRRFRHRLTIG